MKTRKLRSQYMTNGILNPQSSIQDKKLQWYKTVDSVFGHHPANKEATWEIMAPFVRHRKKLQLL